MNILCSKGCRGSFDFFKAKHTKYRTNNNGLPQNRKAYI